MTREQGRNKRHRTSRWVEQNVYELEGVQKSWYFSRAKGDDRRQIWFKEGKECVHANSTRNRIWGPAEWRKDMQGHGGNVFQLGLLSKETHLFTIGQYSLCGLDLRSQIARSQIGTNTVQLLPSPTQHRPFLENPHHRQLLLRNTTQANQNEDTLFVRRCFHCLRHLTTAYVVSEMTCPRHVVTLADLGHPQTCVCIFFGTLWISSFTVSKAPTYPARTHTHWYLAHLAKGCLGGTWMLAVREKTCVTLILFSICVMRPSYNVTSQSRAPIWQLWTWHGTTIWIQCSLTHVSFVRWSILPSSLLPS